MTGDDEIHLCVASAQESLHGLREMPDYRARYTHLGFAAVQAGCALALAVNRLADVLEDR